MARPVDTASADIGPTVFPDPLTSTNQISAATFLYFDTPIVLPSPIWIPDERAYELHDVVASRRPEWGRNFFAIDNLYGDQVDRWKRTTTLLDPLRDSFRTALFSFDAGATELEEGLALLEATGETPEWAMERIDLRAAAGEVFHHLLIDQYVEFERDLDVLYDYCGALFDGTSLPRTLASCYLPRLTLTNRIAGASGELLFNNVRLLALLARLPIRGAIEGHTVDPGVIAWEIFAQLIAQQLDPLDAHRVDRLALLRANHSGEVRSLKTKCERLAQRLARPDTVEDLIPTVERFLRLEVNDEVAALFELDRSALKRFAESVITDEKTWLAVTTSIASAVGGQGILTAGAALATLSSLGAKAAKAAVERRTTLAASDYRVLYRIGQL